MSSGFGWVLAASLSACATIPTDVTRTARADLSCPDAEVTKLANGRYGASGCGKGAVYAEVCEGGECRVGRLRHGHEVEIGQRLAPPTNEPARGEAAPRAVTPAPAPEQREVLPAPASPEREILPAPPPSSSGPGASAESSGGENAAPPAPVPLSQGELSAPFEAEVPAAPAPQQVSSAPPEPLVEDRPPPPEPRYVWVGGYWWWGNSNWLWLPGYWCSPMVGYSYMPGYWYWSVGYWNYWPGGWGYPGSTVIVHRVPPRPRNIVTVRSFQPREPARGTVVATSTARPGGRVDSARPAFAPRSSPLLRYPVRSTALPATSSSNRNANYGAIGMSKARSGSVGQTKAGPGSVGTRVPSNSARVPSTSVGRVVKPSTFGAKPTQRSVSPARVSPSVQRSINVPRSTFRAPPPPRSAPTPRMAPIRSGGGKRR
jgi:hypothetical protein